MNTADENGKNGDAGVTPPVSAGVYKDALKNLDHDKLVDGLVANGIPKDEAEEFANEVDEDR